MRVKFKSRHVLRFSWYTTGTPYSLVLLLHILLFAVAGATASLENVITQSPREAAQTETEARGKTHWRIQIPGDRGELAVLVTHERRSAVVYRSLRAPPNVISSSGSPLRGIVRPAINSLERMREATIDTRFQPFFSILKASISFC